MCDNIIVRPKSFTHQSAKSLKKSSIRELRQNVLVSVRVHLMQPADSCNQDVPLHIHTGYPRVHCSLVGGYQHCRGTSSLDQIT
jgi:hypothetical protein